MQKNIATLNIPIEAEAYIPPINLTMIRGEGSPRFQLSWQPRSGARAYEVYRSSRPDGGFELIGTTTDTFFTDQDIHDRVFYYVKPISQ
jgi:fibronectin type 3 domain-containing protein